MDDGHALAYLQDTSLLSMNCKHALLSPSPLLPRRTALPSMARAEQRSCCLAALTSQVDAPAELEHSSLLNSTPIVFRAGEPRAALDVDSLCPLGRRSDGRRAAMSSSFVSQLLDSFFPSRSPSVVPQPAILRVMDLSFVLLLLTLFALAAGTEWNLHVVALMGVTCALWGSIRWSAPPFPFAHDPAEQVRRRFVAELSKVETNEEEQQRLSREQQKKPATRASPIPEEPATAATQGRPKAE